MITSQRRWLFAALVALSGCLDPLVDDDVPPRGLVLPAGAEVPDAHDDPQIDAQIADYDGVDAEVPLLAGFSGGAPVSYWDFGPAPEFAAPIFVLVRKDGDDITFVSHNTVIDSIPGDPGYSPYWAVWLVEVTDRYDGEILPSLAAIQEAEELGLVLPPVQQQFSVNCPAVAKGVTLEVGNGQPALPPPSRFYWNGKTVRYYDFGIMPLVDGALTPDQRMYLVRREGGEPLSEPVRGVDLTGDGDIKDTNNIFESTTDDEAWTPLCRTVSVAVPSGYASIDTAMDQTTADYRAATDLFDPDPITGRVVAFEVTEDLRNCPHQRMAGGL